MRKHKQPNKKKRLEKALHIGEYQNIRKGVQSYSSKNMQIKL